MTQGVNVRRHIIDTGKVQRLLFFALCVINSNTFNLAKAQLCCAQESVVLCFLPQELF